MIEVPAEEYDEVIRWCEAEKKERGTTGFIMENPFRDVFDWTKDYAFIAVDMEPSLIPHNAIRYESPTKTLYVFFGRWMALIRKQ